ncbi:conserved hypothetical protein [Nostocoides japonicum T1-X7]|uniref:Uncharacterized protein n=1 Tax=Nostocoides japonicum T1-X7 TaxID=1194083 RepID=A0A077M0L2_9MICO|nr:hypothetical protein [Tetrasphaera japonica]CCH79838.1 conserved hypothetical protein [Tetrasphaera japonica T1-X7]
MTYAYAHAQLARALATATEHEDAETRKRADVRVRDWASVLEGMAEGRIDVGSRAPVRGLPAWVTLDVARGGFATGRARAGGPFDDDELERLQRLGLPRSREALFASYLTDAGMEELWLLLESRSYEVRLPEDGALLTVAALTRQGHRASALDLLATLRPYAASLRFMPRAGRPSTMPAEHVYRRSAADVQASLERIAPNSRVETQREALSVWIPLTDRFVAFWAGRSAADFAWGAGATATAETLLTAYDSALQDHPRCRKYRHPKENLAILVAATRAALVGELDERWRGRVRHVLACVEAKRGAVDDAATATLRRTQVEVAALPAQRRVATVAAARLATMRPDEGVLDIDLLLAPVTPDEEAASGVPALTAMPGSVGRKVRLGLSAPAEELVAKGVVPSAEVLAELVPALTARQVSASVDDPDLGPLMGATYAAFRRRRTLLLLNLRKQVQFTELPWVGAAMTVARAVGRPDDPARVARRVAALAIDSFPGTILPNPLISELATLYATGGEDVPLTEELAADIFMGRFSPRFTRAARLAAEFLRGSLYERYYDLDVAEVLSIPEPEPKRRRRGRWIFRGSDETLPVTFADLCSRGVPQGNRWSVVRNGMIIERQQVLTTHNLAALLGVGGVQPTRSPEDLAKAAAGCTARLLELAQRQERPLAAIKDAAYAWRQAVFFLSLIPGDALPSRVDDLRALPSASRRPMSDVIDGLASVVAGRGPRDGMRPFLGWSVGPHWALSSRSGR